jgi:hypothetical protein
VQELLVYIRTSQGWEVGAVISNITHSADALVVNEKYVMGVPLE